MSKKPCVIGTEPPLPRQQQQRAAVYLPFCTQPTCTHNTRISKCARLPLTFSRKGGGENKKPAQPVLLKKYFFESTFRSKLLTNVVKFYNLCQKWRLITLIIHTFVVFCDVQEEKSAIFNCSSLCQHRHGSWVPLFSLQHNNTQPKGWEGSIGYRMDIGILNRMLGKRNLSLWLFISVTCGLWLCPSLPFCPANTGNDDSYEVDEISQTYVMT